MTAAHPRVPDPASGPPPDPLPDQSPGSAARWWRQMLHDPWARVTAAGWLAVNTWVLIAAEDSLPFEWPNATSASVPGQLLDTNLALLQVFALMALVRVITRKRVAPDLLARAPARSIALRETVLLLLYGFLGLAGGFLLAQALGWQSFGLHLAGTLHATHDGVGPVEAVTWAVFNLTVYAVAPLLFFRRRYSALALNLRSTNRRSDALVILVVLGAETAFQLLTLKPGTFDLTTSQLALGAAATFVLYLAGAVLPAMVFIYAILVPRYLRLTGSTIGTVVLGGATYAALHVWDSWTLFDSPANAVLSIIFLLFTYFGPGMMKTYLTVRTGNAWVHVWAYHALAPHTLVDTPHTVEIFHIR